MNAADLPRCALAVLDTSDLKAAVNDAGLALMLAENRQVVTYFTLDDGEGPQKIGVIMSPPRPLADHAVVVAIGGLTDRVTSAAAIIVGILGIGFALQVLAFAKLIELAR